MTKANMKIDRKISGYYRQPTIHENKIVFVCEDDLWVVSTQGGVPRRLTANQGAVARPRFSRNGKTIVFAGREEGPPEVYCMPAEGGSATRLTYLGMLSHPVGFSRDDKNVFLASNAQKQFGRIFSLFQVPLEGGPTEPLPWGPASDISFGPLNGTVLGRNTGDPARWKRYRGGTAGTLWIDKNDSGSFIPLTTPPGNISHPLWVQGRIYFVSDHDGVSNIFSCSFGGKALQQHTFHRDFFVRFPSTDENNIVYQCGAELWILNLNKGKPQKVEIEWHSPRVHCRRKFVDAGRFLEEASLHPKGHSTAVVSRGHAFHFAHWEGAVSEHNRKSLRTRLLRWLSDGKRMIAVSDNGKEENLVIIHADGREEYLEKLDIGRPIELTTSPKGDFVALSNHRYELMIVDLKKKKASIIDKNFYESSFGTVFSPDGRWLAYHFMKASHVCVIKLFEAASRKSHEVTRGEFRDISPSFDPDGKYLYFLSYRDFDPVYDTQLFDLGFPRGMRPCLVTLQADTISPFVPSPRAPGEKSNDNSEEAKKNQESKSSAIPKKEPPKPLKIDLKGIQDRVIAFPVSEGNYRKIQGLSGGKVLWISFPIEGSLKRSHFEPESEGKGTIEKYDFDEQRLETLTTKVSTFCLNQDGKTLLVRSGHKLRVIKAGEKPDDKFEKECPCRKNGWLDLSRLNVAVEPSQEWRQMFREAWRLQRDHFWTQNLSGVDWGLVYKRYLPFLDKIACRSELSDLLWEMQGELGTSHAYEIGGDYRPEPNFAQGFLGANLNFNKKQKKWVIERIVQGDGWEAGRDSCLRAPGLNVPEEATLISVDGVHLNNNISPFELLMKKANREITLEIIEPKGTKPRFLVVKPLSDETKARYREWVRKNREIVHSLSKGRVGYIHIPDMGPTGYSEFHRSYLAEVEHEGLLIDVRCNGGGHVSQLILEKLSRKRIAYVVSRWGLPEPYPFDSPRGPMVTLTDEQAGSDGDIFSHCFKLMKLGPLIGKRTWGGVVGIGLKQFLIDGGLTTQPEYSFWFSDVGWRVENYGTEPDIEVDISPQDYAKGADPQLKRSLDEVLKLLKQNPPILPDFSKRPFKPLPK